MVFQPGATGAKHLSSCRCIFPFVIFKVPNKQRSLSVPARVQSKLVKDKPRGEECAISASVKTKKTNVGGEQDESSTVYRAPNPSARKQSKLVKVNVSSIDTTNTKEDLKKLWTCGGMRDPISWKTTTKNARVIFVPES